MASIHDRYDEALQFLYDRINYEKTVSAGSRYPFRLRRMVWLAQQIGLSDWLAADSVDDHKPSQKAEIAREDADSNAEDDACRDVAPPVGMHVEQASKTQNVPIVHIAGTKGKGSTATLVAAALTTAGYRTGTYTSPHLHRLEERFRIDGEPCSPDQLADLVQRLRPICEQLEASEEDTIGPPTFFELTTAIALLHFRQQACDAIVIEVGLGGRLDSTNVVAPSVTAITSIGLDHQHVLGDTKALIAKEKAGIAKRGVPMICGVVDEEPKTVIQQITHDCSARLLSQADDFTVSQRQLAVGWGSNFTFHSNTTELHDLAGVYLSLEGGHQVDNAAVAIAILQTLDRQSHVQISDDAIRSAFANVSMPARIEKYPLDDGVLAIVDAAHNEDSMTALIDSLQARSPYQRDDSAEVQSESNKLIAKEIARLSTVFIFGTSIDKDARSMLRQIIPFADSVILTRFHGNPRFTPTDELLPIAHSIQHDFGLRSPKPDLTPILVEEDPVAACQIAQRQLPDGGRVVICGSFFLAAEVRDYFRDHQSIDDAADASETTPTA